MPTITINGQSVSARRDQTVLEAATEAGIQIPTLCHHKDLSLVGSCRMCIVEVDSIPGQVASCTLPVQDDLIVRTETTELDESRRMLLEMLLTNYDASSDQTQEPDNEFTRLLRRFGIQPPTHGGQTPRYQRDSDPNPFIRVDLNQCILCTLCVRACEEVQGRSVWGVGFRGDQARIVAGLDTSMLDARCESCGLCSDVCPTNALTDRMLIRDYLPDRLVKTTCGYCGVGCQFDLNVKDEQVVAVTSNATAPVNGHSLCVKGRYGWDYLHHQDRLTSPRVRRDLLDNKIRQLGAERSEWVDVHWDTALNLVATKFSEVRLNHGPNAIGVLSSAKCTNEENYLMQKFARQVIGTNNVDHCARLCHSSTVAGLAMAYGSGAMSNSMRDVADSANSIFVIGSNTTEQHPVFGAMIRQAVTQRGVKLVVADPRRIDLTEFAQLHIQQTPGTDVALLNGIMHIIIENDWHDHEFIDSRCEGFDSFRETIDRYTPSIVSKITDVSTNDLYNAAEIIAQNSPMAVVWAMGITQHTTGVINVLALANLQMLLGNMGVPGGGVNPLRGQNNVQGACDFGALPNVYPGYQSVSNPDIAIKFQTAWKCTNPPESVTTASDPLVPGLTVTEIVDAGGKGDIRAIYILGEDPVMTEPDSNRLQRSLFDTEFVVLQEIFPSETSHFADVLLPGAAFAEKNGSFTNTERRIQLIQKAIEPPGSAEADWAIIAKLANRLLSLERREPVGQYADWNYDHCDQIMNEIGMLTPSYAGVNHNRLKQGEQLQWPVPNANHPGTPILHVQEFARGLGKFHAVDHLPPAELPDSDFPILLTTGRVLYHWHGGEQTRRSASLLNVYPESLVEINMEDATRHGVADGTPIRIESRRGVMEAIALVTERVPPGVIFGNFHFPGRENVNNLTNAALDPTAKIPEYKVCAVRIMAGGI